MHTKIGLMWFSFLIAQALRGWQKYMGYTCDVPAVALGMTKLDSDLLLSKSLSLFFDLRIVLACVAI